MGRNVKTGLSYFPMDVDFFEDEKILFVSARFGVKGEGLVVRLLCKIFRNGYCIDFNDDVALLFARSVGDISLHGLVNDVVSELLKRGFFDKDIFKKFGILTSVGIQKRYQKICMDARRVGWEIPEKHDLLRSKPAFTQEETPNDPEESTQRKEKETKEEYEARMALLSKFREFQKWVKDNAPRVAQMKEPFTFTQWQKATDEFGKIGTVIKSMHNYEPLLRKNRSAYLTLCNWKRRDTAQAA